MPNDTTAPTRQLALVELDGHGQPVGPTVRWPQDWPSAAETIDLTAATLDQALERYRDWITSSDSCLPVDVGSVRNDRRIRVVLIAGRAWLARLEPLQGERPAHPGERCCCGRPAITVYRTEVFGDVPSCDDRGDES